MSPGIASTVPNGSSAEGSSRTKLDYSKYLSDLAKNFPQSPIRGLFKAELIPGMVSFLAGKPNPNTFPFQSISVTLKPESSGSAQAETVTIDGADLDAALQYSATAGLPRLNKWLTDLITDLHDRPAITEAEKAYRTEWRLSVGSGSQDLLTKTFSALLNPGDSILVESPCYAGVIPSMTMIPANIIPVQADDQGASPKALRTLLENWNTAPSTSGKRFPKALYIVPTGANPAGTTASHQRKREILAVARQYDIIILEDDPYYFLAFEGLGEDPVTRPRPKSLFALEKEDSHIWGDGRVLRFDSFSKILSAGIRLGFVSGPKPLVDAIDTLTASMNLQPSGPPQALALALLERWGREGFLRHVDSVSSFYAARRDDFEEKVRKVLGASADGSRPAVAEWVSPLAGMFLWLKLKLPPTPDSPAGDSKELIEGKARAKGFLAVPGISFQPGSTTSPYVRTSFSVVPQGQVEPGLEKLRSVIEEAWQEAGLQLK